MLIILKIISIFYFFLLVLSNFIIFVIVERIKHSQFNHYRANFDSLEEKINILSGSIDYDRQILCRLPERFERITSLFSVSQKFDELDNPDLVCNLLIKTTKELLPRADNILLFITNQGKNSISLIKSSKHQPEILIEEKRGDIIDTWILRHNQSLLIDDITKDFRFDSAEVTSFKKRSARSFLLSPLSIGENVVGLIRAESCLPKFFTMDDSRLLRSICDLGVIVLERANLLRHTEELAIKDSLTELYLRDYFFTRLNEAIRRVNELRSRMGIIMLDIDDFKQINDAYGHIVGDIILQRLACVLKEVVDGTDNVAARYGGEEFMFYLIDTDKKQMLEIAEKVRKTAQNLVVNFRRKKITFTVSIGAILYPDDEQDLFDLMSKVDQLLYKAKHEGKNKVCFL